jgi:hypothetical protein
MICAIVPRSDLSAPGKRHGRAAKTRLRMEGPYFEAELCFAQKPIAGAEFQIGFNDVS